MSASAHFGFLENTCSSAAHAGMAQRAGLPRRAFADHVAGTRRRWSECARHFQQEAPGEIAACADTPPSLEGVMHARQPAGDTMFLHRAAMAAGAVMLARDGAAVRTQPVEGRPLSGSFRPRC